MQLPFETIQLRLLHRNVLFLMLGLITGCNGPGEPSPPISQSLRTTDSRPLVRANLGEPRTLDQQLADDESSLPILRDLFEGLTSETADGKVAPGTAESWIIDSSGTNYRFRLRKNARWSDGDKVIAAEVVEGIRRAVDPRTAAGSASQLSIIKNASAILSGHAKPISLGISAESDELIQIELERPAVYFLQILSQPICAPIHLHERSTMGSEPHNTNKIVSNGPFLLNRWIPGAYALISENPNYWNQELHHVGTVKYLFEASEATELNQYLAGELDITSTIPMPDFARVLKQYPDEVQTAPILGTLFVALNNTKPPFSNSQKLRQALSMAVERELISEKIAMGTTPAFGLVATGTNNYTQQRFPWFGISRAERIKQARTLYADAGYSANHPLHFRLYFNSNEGIKRLMVALAASWKENLGADVELVSSEFRVFLEDRKDRSKWDAIRLGWYADYNDAASFLEMFESTNAQNDAGYHNSEFDQLIHNAQLQPNSELRRQFLERAEQIILSDNPIVPIYFYNARRLVKPSIIGAAISPMNRTYSKFLQWK